MNNLFSVSKGMDASYDFRRTTSAAQTAKPCRRIPDLGGYAGRTRTAVPKKPRTTTQFETDNDWGYANDSDDCVQLSRRSYDIRTADGHLRLFARHRVRVVRLLHLRNARRVPGEILLLQRAAQRRLHLCAARLCRRLCRPPVRRA